MVINNAEFSNDTMQGKPLSNAMLLSFTVTKIGTRGDWVTIGIPKKIYLNIPKKYT